MKLDFRFRMIFLFSKGLFTYYVSQKRGFVDPPPLSANVSFWLTPPPPLVSFCQQLADPPSPLRQLSSAFGKRPICTTNFTEDFLK